MNGVVWRRAERTFDNGGNLIVLDRSNICRDGLHPGALRYGPSETVDTILPTVRSWTPSSIASDLLGTTSAHLTMRGSALIMIEPHECARFALDIRPFIRVQNQRPDWAPQCIRHDLAPTTQVKARIYNDMDLRSK